MKRAIFILLFLFLTIGLVKAEVITEEITYQVGEENFKGYLAYNDRLESLAPAILVVHEWWGHNDYARRRAWMLADLGYTAMAIDMYGDGKTADHPDDAGKFAGLVSKNMEGVGKERFLAALKVLKEHPTTDIDRIAAIGYCFGGGTVLHMARFGVDLTGVVSFHGSLKTNTPAQKGQVKARILVCHGADDPFIPQEDIVAFKDEMDEAGADYRFISYEGAVHSFTNPDADKMAEKFGLSIAYNKNADQQSWHDMKYFFQDIFND